MRRARAAPVVARSSAPCERAPSPDAEGGAIAVVTWAEFDHGENSLQAPTEHSHACRNMRCENAAAAEEEEEEHHGDAENGEDDSGVELSDSLASLLARPDRAPPPTRRRARWRRLLARQDLVDKGLSARPPAPDRHPSSEQSPRSSFEFEEPKSLTSWGDEPPSPTLRSWRSVSSRSFVPRQEEPPRPLAMIGRQACMNDISDIVDAANSPCISYDRQIFDPTSKLWRYVEADIEPTSSPWELRPNSLGSPVTTVSTTTQQGGGSASSPSIVHTPRLLRATRGDLPFRERSALRGTRKISRGVPTWNTTPNTTPNTTTPSSPPVRGLPPMPYASGGERMSISDT